MPLQNLPMVGEAESLFCFSFSAIARAFDNASLKLRLGLPDSSEGGGGTAE